MQGSSCGLLRSNSYGFDPVKDACVQKIKAGDLSSLFWSRCEALQRSSEDAKQQWALFCDDQHGGIRDPTRGLDMSRVESTRGHSVKVLQDFLATLG